MTNGLNARQQQILELLQAEGEVRIADLKERFSVTEMTLRRDLEKLEATGDIRRTFGGAILVSRDIALQDRIHLHAEAKMKIGKLAASLIKPGESVFIDAGSTTLQLVRHLPAGYAVTVVTNAINVAAELLNRQIQTIVTGGALIGKTAALTGPIAERSMAGLAFDRAFIGATGCHPAHGFSNSNMLDAEIKRLAIRQARETNIVMDSSKFGVQALVSFASFGEARRLITDRRPEGELEAALAASGVDLLIAE